MTKYEELKKKADNYKNSLAHAIAYRDNLEAGFIVSKTNSPVMDRTLSNTPFAPVLSNRNSTAYGYIDAAEFTKEELDILKALVQNHVKELEKKYEEAAIKLQAVEDLLS